MEQQRIHLTFQEVDELIEFVGRRPYNEVANVVGFLARRKAEAMITGDPGSHEDRTQKREEENV